MITLTGDPYNLQGGAPAVPAVPQVAQATIPQLGPAAPITPPTPAKSAPSTPLMAPSQVAIVPPHIAQPDKLNSIFDPFIGSRPSASNPGVLEYFNKQNGQGFSNANDLFGFASQLGGGQISSFDQLHAPVNGSPASSAPYTPGIPAAAAVDPNQTTAAAAGTANLSPTDLLSLIQSKSKLTPDELTQIRAGLGIDQATQAAFAPPAQTSVDFYNSAYTNAGLGDLKQTILNFNKQIAERQQQYTDAANSVNENPFLSEASRTGRLSTLQDKANADIGNIVSQQQQAQTLYQNGINEVNTLVTNHTNDFQTNQALNQQKLQALLTQSEAQAQALVAQKEQQAYTYLPAYLQAKAKATSSNTVTAPNGAIFQFNPTTGTFDTIQPANGNFDVNPITGDLFSKNTGQGLGTGSSSPSTAGSISIPANTLAGQNNNPGNLRFAGQPGATQGAGGFAKFATPEAGYQALINQVQLDASRGETLSQYITKFAPPSENNTAQYIQQAASALGVSANTPLSQIDPNAMAAFQAQKESGTSVGQASAGNIVDQTAQGLVDRTINPNQLSPRSPGYLQILQRANQISLQQTGKPFDAAAAEQNYNATQQALNKNATDYRTLQKAQQTAVDHLSQLETLSGAAKRYSSPIANEGLLYTKGTVQGDSNYTSYLSAIGVVQSEVAKVLGGGTTTVESLKEAQGVINPYLSHQGLIDAINNVKNLMSEKIKEYTSLDDIPQLGQSNNQSSANSDPLGLGI